MEAMRQTNMMVSHFGLWAKVSRRICFTKCSRSSLTAYLSVYVPPYQKAKNKIYKDREAQTERLGPLLLCRGNTPLYLDVDETNKHEECITPAKAVVMKVS